MRIKFKQNYSDFTLRRSSGSVLLDVLLAIVIFVIGMLALASLQGNLTRSSADANARTMGTNVAEELIEEFRTFRSLRTANGTPAYQQIVDQTRTFYTQDGNDRGGIDYTVVVTVEDWYFMPDSVSITKNTGDLPSTQETTISDFKYLELAVSWESPEFQISEGVASSDRLGSGAFVVSSIVPSIPQLGSAKIAADDDGALGTPPIDYTPGQRPDIVAIALGPNKFKESTTPEPIVIRLDELVETWFDVITYNQIGAAIFLRREEFVSISCKCELQAAGSAKVGRAPTIWTGAEYAEGDLKIKPYGVSASNQQSQYCDVCCKDHHDSSTGDKYRPWMSNGDYVNSGAFKDDHPHYNDELIEATTSGDTYLEACRLVRKDGFFRVAQDFNIHEISAFPEDYLTTEGDITEYSNYVTAVVDSELGSGAAPAPANVTLSYSGRDSLIRSDVTESGQKLRSRGIYIDTMNSALQDNIDNCFGSGVRNDCEAPEATSVYELYPFFDVQVTHLARWSVTPQDGPVVITDEEMPKQSNQTYSRGWATHASAKVGYSTGNSKIESGNVGLIGIDPIADVPTPVFKESDIFLEAVDLP